MWINHCFFTYSWMNPENYFTEPEKGTHLAKATGIRPPMALNLTLPVLQAAQWSCEQQGSGTGGWGKWWWGLSPQWPQGLCGGGPALTPILGLLVPEPQRQDHIFPHFGLESPA